MIPFALTALLPLAAAAAPALQPDGVEIADVTITRSIIIRVPSRKPRPAPLPPDTGMKEKKGPKCVPASDIAAAAVTAPDAVDIILRGGQRVRAKLEDACPALDYYSGFYVHPGADGKICADRDAIRTRSGGDCQIDKFRLLVPRPAP